MITFNLYALKSLINNHIYIGITRNPEKRLRQHNLGQTKSTKFFRPWFLIYVECIGSLKEARQKEVAIKKSYSKRKFLYEL